MSFEALKRSVVALAPALMLVLTSCSSNSRTPIGDATAGAAYQHGVPGGVVVETYDLTARVTDLDSRGRKVTLLTRDGRKTTVKCGPEVVNFDRIRVGDELNLTVTSELAVAMANANAASTDGGAAMVLLAPEGGRPGGFMAETVQIVATIVAIDLGKHRVTLEFSDGSTRLVTVRKDVDLTRRHVGEEVVIRVTETVAVSVDKP